jgi:hypothetical protein
MVDWRRIMAFSRSPGTTTLRSQGLLVDADGHAEDEDLRRWVDRGLAYASSLPPKSPRQPCPSVSLPEASLASTGCTDLPLSRPAEA